MPGIDGLESRGHHSATLVVFLAVFDSASVLLALWIASWLRFGTWEDTTLADFFQYHLWYFISFLIAWPVAAAHNRLFISRRRDDLLSLAFDIAKSVALALIFTGFVVAFYTPRGAEQRFFSVFGLSTLACLGFYRLVLQMVLWSLRSHGRNSRQVLIVGANRRTRHLIETMRRNPHYGYNLVGILDDDDSRFAHLSDMGLPCLGSFDLLEDVLKDQVVDEVYICLPVRSMYETIQKIAHRCEDVGVGVRMIADLFPLRLATSRFHKLEDIPILALSTVPENQPQLILQRATDLLFSLFFILLLSPVFIGTAIAIKLDSRGPVFFRQERVGLNQRRFRMWKFRSMVQDAEALREQVEHLNRVKGAMFKAPDDPRMTRVGRFIRKYSIDELPQLFNVLNGDMSLVGPRPPLPSEVAAYSWHQRRRLSVKPGMTGLSQVSGRSELSFDDTVWLDLYYIDQWSLVMVFRILLLTVPAVLKGRGAM